MDNLRRVVKKLRDSTLVPHEAPTIGHLFGTKSQVSLKNFEACLLKDHLRDDVIDDFCGLLRKDFPMTDICSSYDAQKPEHIG